MLVYSKLLFCFYCLQLFNFFRETSPVPPRSRTPSPAKEVSPPTTSSGNSPVLGSIPLLFLHPPCFIDADCLVCLFSTGLTMMGVWHWGASCKFYSNNKGKKKIDDRETGTENKFPWQLPFVMVVKQSMNVVHLLIANTKEQKKTKSIEMLCWKSELWGAVSVTGSLCLQVSLQTSVLWIRIYTRALSYRKRTRATTRMATSAVFGSVWITIQNKRNYWSI